MADLDPKALEVRVTLNPKELIQRLTDELAQLIDGERDDPDAGIRGWNSLHDLVAQAREYLALPPAADDDVAEMVGWLQDAATHEDDKDQRTGLRRGAAMLEALSQSREADRVRARNEGIEMAAKCIEAKHAHNIGGVVHPIAQSDAAAIRALKDRL